MARKLRIEFEGGFYQVITRGNQRQKVFVEEKDFLNTLNASVTTSIFTPCAVLMWVSAP